MQYFHIDLLLDFIEHKEGKEFKIVKSKDYGVEGLLSFTIIIPSFFEIESVKVKEDEYQGYIVEVKDNLGRNAMNTSNVLFWDSELISVGDEENSYIYLDEFDNGLVVFEKFKRIPEFVGSDEILKFVRERGEH